MEILAAALVVLCDFHQKQLDAEKVHATWLRLARIVRALPESASPINVAHADARDLSMETDSADLVFTSPPYIHVFNYHQKYRRSAEALNWDILTVARSNRYGPDVYEDILHFRATREIPEAGACLAAARHVAGEVLGHTAVGFRAPEKERRGLYKARPPFLKASNDHEFKDGTQARTHLAYVAAEIKTNPDKTMFQEAAATANDLRGMQLLLVIALTVQTQVPCGIGHRLRYPSPGHRYVRLDALPDLR